MARNFDDILREVTSKSDPQRKIVLDQIAALPGQQQADEAGLEAKKTQAFDEILGGARRRGLGFSGIPLGEQAKYSATEYAPAVANLKSGYNTRRGALESALADFGRSDYTTAYDIFDRDRQMEEQRRQFDLNYALQQQAAAESRRAAASTFAPTFGGGPNARPSATKVDQNQQRAYNDVRTRIDTQSSQQLLSDFVATASSAKNGNPVDLIKLQIYRQLKPELFKGKYSWER